MQIRPKRFGEKQIRALRAAALLCGALCLAVGYPSTATAAAAGHWTFNLPKQPLSAAVRAICRIAGVNVLFDPSLTDAHAAPDVRGDMSFEEALTRVLAPSGFSFLWTDEHSILIRRNDREVAAGPGTGPVTPAPARAAPRAATNTARSLPAAPPVAADEGEGELLARLIVTATRQPNVVGRVPVSVTALTQRALDLQNQKTAEDVARSVPAVTLRAVGGIGQGSVLAIRGIASNYGASTTGVYLDDAPLQKRGFSGTFSGNGNPYPVLFDLNRVEVLRGPQGTLFGSGSEGGTIRFITPTPSLEHVSGYGHAEISNTDGGDISYEGGAAVGGPVMRDRLGFRLSLIGRHNGGYVDHVSLYDAHEFATNTNSEDQRAVRLALLWAASDRLKVSASLYASRDHVADSSQFIEDIPQYTVNSGVFTNAGVINGIPFDFPNTAFKGGTYGPFNQYGPYKSRVGYYLDESHDVIPVYSPVTSTLFVPSVSIDYDFGKITLKSITSFVKDKTSGVSPGVPPLRTPILCPMTCPGFVDPVTGLPVTGGTGRMAFIPGFPSVYEAAQYTNARSGITEEVRLLSLPDARPVNFVTGLFYSHQETQGTLFMVTNEDASTTYLHGIPEQWFMGEQNLGLNSLTGDIFGIKDSKFDEMEIAAFGEANYFLTERLKVTAGLRMSYNRIRFSNTQGGPIYGAPPDFVPGQGHVFPDQPGDQPLTHDGGTQTGSPVTPKFGLAWQGDRNFFYVTMSEGYRPGGVNTRPWAYSCAADIAKGSSPPMIYGSDSVTSYESGAKMASPIGRGQINVSLFYTNWVNPQISRRLSCGFNYVINSGAAVSKGFDIQAEQRLWDRLTLSGSIAYTDARFTKTVYGDVSAAGGASIIVNAGDQLGSPKWQVSVGSQYDFRLFGKATGYIRGDYQYSSRYQRGVGPGAVGYDPVIAVGAATHYVSASAGVTLDDWQAKVFVRNLTGSTDRLSEAHGAVAPDVVGTTFRPREIGLAVTRVF